MSSAWSTRIDAEMKELRSAIAGLQRVNQRPGIVQRDEQRLARQIRRSTQIRAVVPLNLYDDAGAAADRAPKDAEYLVGAANSVLTAERLVTDGTSIVWDVSVPGQVKVKRAALTGDVTASADANGTTIAANAVTDAKFRQSGALTVVGRAGNTTGDVADIGPAASSGDVLRRSGASLGFGTIPSTSVTGLGTMAAQAQIAAQGDSTAATVGDLKTDFNALLAKMRTSGALAP